MHRSEFGYLLLSRTSGRQFFCPEGSACVQTQFSGSVSRCFEAWACEEDYGSVESDVEVEGERATTAVEDGLSIVSFDGRAFRYFSTRPLALKTCRIEVLKLEAQWQQRELGELTGEVSVLCVGGCVLLFMFHWKFYFSVANLWKVAFFVAPGDHVFLSSFCVVHHYSCRLLLVWKVSRV